MTRKMAHKDLPMGSTLALDAQHLSETTFGDHDLRREIIVLFQRQLESARAQLATACHESDWRFVNHTLKGAASAIGAIQFAEYAGAWELHGLPDESERAAILAEFDLAADAFKRAIALG
jgi:HPt (histidine-containing phosphotransfer) domain-containing protein